MKAKKLISLSMILVLLLSFMPAGMADGEGKIELPPIPFDDDPDMEKPVIDREGLVILVNGFPAPEGDITLSAGDGIAVEVPVTDNAGVKLVELTLTGPTGTDSFAAMTLDSGTGRFRWALTVTADTAAGEWTILCVDAVDTSDNSSGACFISRVFTVTAEGDDPENPDTEKPVIDPLSVCVTPESVVFRGNETVTLSVSVTDNIAVASVSADLHCEGCETVPGSGVFGDFIGLVLTTDELTGLYSVKFRTDGLYGDRCAEGIWSAEIYASDKAGNTASLKAENVFTVSPNTFAIEISGPDELRANKSGTFTAEILPENITESGVVWSLEYDEALCGAEIDEYGVLTVGDVTEDCELTVTATAADGFAAPGTKTVTLRPALSYAIEVTAADGVTEVTSGKSLKLTAAISPERTGSFAWKIVEGAKYGSVDKYGVFKAAAVKTAQTVVITARETTSDAKLAGDPRAEEGSITLTVRPKATKVTILNADGEAVTGRTAVLDVNPKNSEGELSLSFTASAYPADAAQGITWQKVSSAYGTLTDNGDGSCTFVPSGKTGMVSLTAKAADGSGKSAKVSVKLVKYADALNIICGGEEKDAADTRTGKSIALKTDISTNPENKGITDKTVSWTLSGVPEGYEKYISLSGSGVLKVAKNGSKLKGCGRFEITSPVTVTVSACAKKNPAAADSIEVRIYPAVTGVQILLGGEPCAKGKTVASLSLVDGENASVRLDGICLPDEAMQGGTWKSGSKKTALVDETGLVTAKGKGTVTITFTAADGTKKATNVRIKVTG